MLWTIPCLNIVNQAAILIYPQGNYLLYITFQDKLKYYREQKDWCIKGNKNEYNFCFDCICKLIQSINAANVA